MIWLYWITGRATGAIWLVGVSQAVMNLSRIADIMRPEWLPSDKTSLPSLTVVAPGRNEEAALEPALRSLAQLDYPNFEVIALNDRSTDSTGEIMDRVAADSAGKVHVLHVRELPAGWLGKTHAIWLGAQPGTGEWILFTDADCLFERTALRRAVFYAEQQRLDHLVVCPTAVMHTGGEKMMMSFFQTMFSVVHRPWKVSDPRAKDYVGMGAFNMVRRDVYNRIGTYERLRLEVVDDMKLGEAAKPPPFPHTLTLVPPLFILPSPP